MTLVDLHLISDNFEGSIYCEEGLTSNTVISKTVISNLDNGNQEFNLKTRF